MPSHTTEAEPIQAGDARLPRYRVRVRPEWIDGNRHMNACYYLAAIKDPAIDVHRQWDYAEDFRARTGESNFVLEAHVVYIRELLLDDPFVVVARITDLRDKTMTVLFELIHERSGQVAALVEYLLVHVGLGPPPAARSMPGSLRARLAAELARHAEVPLPVEALRLPTKRADAAGRPA